ncbi:MAG TPA: class I SAM-dependent methyltransferase [Candidatus Saccharimonadales bacterium]|nr:class I SAM-dependent methyltransferase [Candidatus Saccharimonadales bacterium]
MQDTFPQWNNAADWYDQNMGSTGDALNAGIIRPLVLEMLGDIGGKRVLDAGCGSGYLAAELAERAQQVTGTDFAPNFVAICKQKYADRDNLDFLQHDLTAAFPFPDASFDVIVCKMVLQYVPDVHMFAAEAQRLLAPNGTVLVIVDHPFRAAYFNAQRAGGPASDLFAGQAQTKMGLWGKTELTWYARTTSDYVQAFTNAGLRLIAMREPLERVDATHPIPFSVLALQFGK